jgi:hypothetical protein
MSSLWVSHVTYITQVITMCPIMQVIPMCQSCYVEDICHARLTHWNYLCNICNMTDPKLWRVIYIARLTHRNYLCNICNMNQSFYIYYTGNSYVSVELCRWHMSSLWVIHVTYITHVIPVSVVLCRWHMSSLWVSHVIYITQVIHVSVVLCRWHMSSLWVIHVTSHNFDDICPLHSTTDT